MTISLITGDMLRGSATLQEELHDLARPSYEDPASLLSREYADCTHVYLGRDVDAQLLCAYLTTWEHLLIDRDHVPAVHLGLSLTRQDTKNTGVVAALYSRCLNAVRVRQDATGRPHLLWSTTASPTVFLAVTRHLAEVAPCLDGSYSPHAARVVVVLRQRLGIQPAAPHEHPFVARGVAAGTRYSLSERRRIDTVRRRKHFTLFDQLGLDEANGDRLIFSAYLPYVPHGL